MGEIRLRIMFENGEIMDDMMMFPSKNTRMELINAALRTYADENVHVYEITDVSIK